jgi:demethylmenaquinone methyltransferase/2-methoxy-6-polyprenyl-1,4-benzoquinol methylase
MAKGSTALYALVLIPLAGIAIHYWLFSNVATPPPDFGSGSMFDTIAPRYDLVNRVLALNMDVGWRRALVQQVKERSPESPKILDLATGTADVALLLADGIPGSTVIGVDPSNSMLNIGRVKVRDRKLEERIELRQGDAQDLMDSLEESSFDAATMSFGIRNVPNREKALCEIHRVLSPNSVFCILEFSEPDDDAGIMGYLARIFIRHVVPVLGGIVSGAPREYLHLQNSIKDFPSPKEFGALMERLECGEDGRGAFRLDELIQMNFGSVQLYVATRITRPAARVAGSY